MPLERPRHPLILVTDSEDEWSRSFPTNMPSASIPTTPPRSESTPTQPSSPSPSPRRKIRVRTPLSRAPPSSLALKNMSRLPSSPHILDNDSKSPRAHDHHHYTDVFGTRLDSPFQEDVNALGDVWVEGGFGGFGMDDEVDLDGFKLAMSPDPFKTGSRDEIRASMEMDLPPTPRLDSPFHTPRPKKSSKLAQSTTPTSTSHSSPELTPLTRPPFFFSPSSSSCSSTTSPLSSSLPGTPQSRPMGYFPSPMIQSPGSVSSPTTTTKFGASWSPLNSMRRKKGEEGLIGLGIRAEGEKAGLARLEMGSLGGNAAGQDGKQGEYNDDLTPTGARPSMRLSPAMVSRSRSTTPTANATFAQGSSTIKSNDHTASTSGGSSDESTTTTAASIATNTTRTSRRAMATASLKRMFRNTFQSPRTERGFSVSRQSKQDGFEGHTESGSKLMQAFLPPVPKIDMALLSDGAGIESWQKRSSSSPNGHRRVSTVGAAKGSRMRRSKTEMGVWFTEASPPRHDSVKFPSSTDSRRPPLMRTDHSVLYPGSPTSMAIARERRADRTRAGSPSPCTRRRSASSPQMLHMSSDNSTDGDDSSEASDTDEDKFSEESFTSDPMMSPRDVDVDFSFDHKAKTHLSPTGTVSSDGTSTWQYSRYGTKGSNGWSGSEKTVLNKDRRSIQHVLDHTGFLSGTMMRDLTVDLDGRRETQRSQALAKLEGRAGSPGAAPEWTNIFESQGADQDDA